ncbi:hypothetical protein H4K36_02390 [Streptomyces sp. DHE7-1]|nr:hypothetical protein [Streptomyces sp. DHE7-1]
MWAVIGFLHVACMRSTYLSKPVLVAALGCVVLSGCGTQHAAADRTPAGSAVSATTTPLDAPRNDPEMRFLELINRVTLECAPDAAVDKGDGAPPEPEDLPGWENAPAPRYGPGETPPGVANADGDIPVPLPSDAPEPPESTPSSAKPSLQEVPLTGSEKCSGRAHAKRVREAFDNTETTSYQAMRKQLTDLDYPASRIHQMPNRAGAPRARLDLRFMGDHLVLEVTGTSSGAIVETFGAPEAEDVKVTDVKRKPKLDAPRP